MLLKYLLIFLKICFCSNVFGLLAGIPATCHFLLGTVKKIFFTVPFFCLLKIVIHGHMEAIPLSYVVLSLQRAAGRDWASTGNCLVTVSPSSLLLADTWSHAAYCLPDVWTHSQLRWHKAFCLNKYWNRTAVCYSKWDHFSYAMTMFKAEIQYVWVLLLMLEFECACVCTDISNLQHEIVISCLFKDIVGLVFTVLVKQSK